MKKVFVGTAVKISIHALVKRATRFLVTSARPLRYFNPRPRKEGDHIFLQTFNWLLNFNPRPRKEGDSGYGYRSCRSRNFNPRPRKEGDINLDFGLGLPCGISIHALVKRATFTTVTARLLTTISIHALVKRATNSYLAYVFSEDISIHALVKRATNFVLVKSKIKIISIHALVKRATVKQRTDLSIKQNFNPRPRKEGDQFREIGVFE